MAAHPIVVVDGGVIQIPIEFKSDPRFQDGATLELIPVQITLDASPVKGNWRRFDGIFADENFDATEWKREEREEELAHDERKFGTPRPSW